MTALIVPASFQDIDEAFEVGVDISMRMIDRMAHAGLSREVDHHGEPMFRKQLAHRRTIGQIGLHETEPCILAQDIQPCLLQRRVIVTVEVVQTDDIAAFCQQLPGDVKADKARRTCDQYCVIRHRNLKSFGRLPRAGPGLFTRRIEGAAIPSCTAIARLALKPYQGGEVRRMALSCAVFDIFSNLASAGEMRRILLSTVKILISAALLYLTLRKVNLTELASRINNVASLGWIVMAIAVTFLQIYVGVLRWREISAECGAPLGTTQAMRFNMIGAFFNQTLPSSIGGDAVRLWLVARGGAGWRAATYSIFVDRAIGLIALAILIVASLPWSYELIDSPQGRAALLFVDFASLAGGLGFLAFGALTWGWLKRWWGTHHIHACAVIADRVIFNPVRGPKIAVLSLLVHVLAVVIAW